MPPSPWPRQELVAQAIAARTYADSLRLTGNPLYDVRLRQWMYLQADGCTVLNHATVNKLGGEIAQVAESFQRP